MAAFAHSSSRQIQQPCLTPSRTTIAPRQLPNGPCHYKDSKGASICGCRQFWLNDISANASTQDGDSTLPAGAWCFCGHHGCFHSTLAPSDRIGTIQDTRQWEDPSGQASRHDATSDWQMELHEPRAIAVPPSGLGINMDYQSSNLPGTPRLGQLNPRNIFADYLPSTQASSMHRSENVSVVGEVFRQTPSTLFRSYAPAVQEDLIPQRNVVGSPRPDRQDDQALSATEVATPSYAGTPGLRDVDDTFKSLRANLEAFNRQYSMDHAEDLKALGGQQADRQSQGLSLAVPATVSQTAAANSSQVTALLFQQIAALRTMLESAPNMTASLQSLNARLEVLETASFCHVAPEEIADRFENFEGRMLDVESQIQDLEKLHEDILHEARQGPRHRTLDKAREDHQRLHNGSISSEFAYDAAEQAARLDIMENRISSLESVALPTPANPWSIEVIFIPFGADLKLLWSQAVISANATSTPYGETDIPGPGTQSGPAENLEHAMDWTATSPNGLVARACGPSSGVPGLIYERLLSRGFVRNVMITNNSARHIFSAIMSSLDAIMPSKPGSKNIESQPLGLQGPYVPLRKVHRSPTLRFLTPAELATPAIWTAEFLHSSVFMRAPSTGLRRFFITEPAAYLQHLPPTIEWDWGLLRSLPRYADGIELPVKEADALEPCWAYDKRVDLPISVHASLSSGLSYHTSFNSHMISPQRTNPSSPTGLGEDEAEHNDQVEEDPASSSFSSSAHEAGRPMTITSQPSNPAPISPISHLPYQHPAHSRIRTISLPSQLRPDSAVYSSTKRQIVSNDHTSPTKPSQTPKRRRVSHSPDDVSLMGLWDLTPRRSREPLSPRQTSMSTAVTWSRRPSSRPSSSGRQGVAFAYATPFSAEFVEFERRSDGPHDVPVEIDAGGSEESYDSDNEDMSVDMDVGLVLGMSGAEHSGEDGDDEDEVMSEDEDDASGSDKEEAEEGEDEWQGVDREGDDDHRHASKLTTTRVSSHGYGCGR